MASLLHLRTQQLLLLSADHTVGRAWGNRLQVEGDLASAHHALIRWTGEGWELRDLGSRNGTWLANHRLAPGEGRLLGPGLSLAFGDPGNRWRVEDLDPPAAMGRGPQGQVERAEDGLLVLPNAARPEICVVQDVRGRWVSEPADGSGEPTPVADGDRVELSDGPWQLWLPLLVSPTTAAEAREPLRLDELELCLKVSSDEEHVEIWLNRGDQTVQLGHRAHSYLLLTLARARLDDAEEDPGRGSRRARLGLPGQARPQPAHPRGPVQRDRVPRPAQLAEARVVGADGLIERRRGSGQLRLGTSRIRIEPL